MLITSCRYINAEGDEVTLRPGDYIMLTKTDRICRIEKISEEPADNGILKFVLTVTGIRTDMSEYDAYPCFPSDVKKKMTREEVIKYYIRRTQQHIESTKEEIKRNHRSIISYRKELKLLTRIFKEERK